MYGYLHNRSMCGLRGVWCSLCNRRVVGSILHGTRKFHFFGTSTERWGRYIYFVPGQDRITVAHFTVENN